MNIDELIESRETPVYEAREYLRPCSKLSDEDMIINGVEDPSYAVFGNLD